MPVHASPKPHVYIGAPTPIFKARVNMPGTISYPVTALIFDTVTLGAYTDLAFDYTLLLGTADGLDDLGRVRVQKLATATTIPIARVSRGVNDGELNIQDNAYITVYREPRLWAKLPWQSPDGVDYKDADVLVGDYMSEPPPVANCGPGTAGTVDAISGLLTVTFPAAGINQSYAVAEGATIASYDWDVDGGTITVGTSASAVITATFEPGEYLITHTVVDSNGQPHSSRCRVVAIGPSFDPTIQSAVPESLRYDLQGSTLRVRIPADLPRSTYPDGAMVMLWIGEPSSPTDRSHIKFIGWEQSNDVSIRTTKQGLVRETILTCVDIAGRLDTLPGFPQALERGDEVYWDHAPNLDMFFAVHYLGFWHSTAWSYADVLVPDELRDYESMRLDSAGSSLYDQINSRVQSMTPDYHFVCNAQGQLSVVRDWRLIDVGDRPTIAGILTESDWTDMRFGYKRAPDIYARRASAVVCSTEWLMLGGQETLPLAFCIAPGEMAFGQGLAEAVTGEKLTQSQTQLNVCEGHRYALDNARFGPVTVTLLDPTTVWDYLPALMQRYQINIPAEIAAQRGLPFTQTNFMALELNVRFPTDKTGVWIDAELTLLFETSGFPAVTHIPEVEGTPDDYETPPPPPPTEPPGGGLEDGVALVAAIGIDGYRYRTFDFDTPSGSGGPTWDRDDLGIGPTLYSWVVDPFSPAYIEGSGTVDGWAVNDEGIYRVEDLFGSTTATLVHTFPVATVGASFHWRSIQASFGAYFAPGANPWLLCVSYYGDTPGHEGTWVTRSLDGGVTWEDEVQISAFYDLATPTRFMPIGVYASPKTPGFALTAAHADAGADPAKLPIWGVWSNVTGSAAYSGPLSSYAVTSSIDLSGVDDEDDGKTLVMIPPANTVRVLLEGFWQSSTSWNEEGTPQIVFALSIDDPATISTVEDMDYDTPDINPPASDANSESFSLEWAYGGGGDWPVNRTSIVGTPLTGPGSPAGARMGITLSGDSSDPDFSQSGSTTVRLRVVEIEFDGGEIYVPPTAAVEGKRTADWGASWAATPQIQPGIGLAGSIHVPWNFNAAEDLAYFGQLQDNAGAHEFRLMKSEGGVVSDISPTESGISYGVNTFGFAIRAFDDDRQYLALGGYGNDTSGDSADDKVGLWVSSNAAAAWTNILAPVAATNAPRGLQIAFGGTDPNILFAWGGEAGSSLEAIYYSDDFGASLDSREGNLGSFGAVTIIGIAGGPG